MLIDGKVGAYRDIEGSRQDVAIALATAVSDSHESVSTAALNSSATEFLDASGCLLGLEVINAE
jgi:hypothetical protein